VVLSRKDVYKLRGAAYSYTMHKLARMHREDVPVVLQRSREWRSETAKAFQLATHKLLESIKGKPRTLEDEWLGPIWRAFLKQGGFIVARCMDNRRRASASAIATSFQTAIVVCATKAPSQQHCAQIASCGVSSRNSPTAHLLPEAPFGRDHDQCLSGSGGISAELVA